MRMVSSSSFSIYHFGRAAAWRRSATRAAPAACRCSSFIPYRHSSVLFRDTQLHPKIRRYRFHFFRRILSNSSGRIAAEPATQRVIAIHRLLQVPKSEDSILKHRRSGQPLQSSNSTVLHIEALTPWLPRFAASHPSNAMATSPAIVSTRRAILDVCFSAPSRNCSDPTQIVVRR